MEPDFKDILDVPFFKKSGKPLNLGTKFFFPAVLKDFGYTILVLGNTEINTAENRAVSLVTVSTVEISLFWLENCLSKA